MAAGNAVFTEVLQIGIDTSVFASQMKQVEQIYANSIKNMPNLGQMGTQLAGQSFQQAAKDIADAAQSIETNVITMSSSVQAALAKMASTASTAGAATAAGVKSAASGMSEGQGAAERFGTAIERALFRLPAMALVGTAMLAVFTALRAPFQALEEGFENLGNQTPLFKQIHTQLADTFSILESVAAKPLFDVVLAQMAALAKWLKDNKVYVENLAYGFGMMISAVATVLIDFAKMDIVKDVFKGIGATIAETFFILTQFTSEIKLVLGLLASTGSNPNKDQGDGTVMGFFKAIGHNAKGMFSNDSSNKALDDYQKEADANAAALVQMEDAINGTASGDKSKGILSKNALKTSQEIMTQYREELSGLKEDHKAVMTAISEQENAQVINKETAKGKIIAAVAAERVSIDGLIGKYKELLKSSTDLTELDSSKMRQKVDMLLLGGRGSNAASPYSQGESETKAATQAADKEAMEAKAKGLADQRSLVEKAYAADLAADKKAEAEKLVTHQATVKAEMALEDERHRQIVALNAQMPDGAVNTPNYLAKQKSSNDEDQKHNEALAASTRALAQATREDIAANNAYSEAIAKVGIAHLEASDKEAVAMGNRRKHLALTKQIIEAELRLTETEAIAGQSALAADTRSGNTPAADTDRAKLASLYAQIDTLKKRLAATAYSDDPIGKLEQARDNNGGPTALDSAGKALGLNFDNLSKDLDEANSSLDKFAIGIEAGVTALASMATAAGQFYTQMKKGGIGSAIGGALSNGKVDDALSSGAQSLGDSLGGAAGGALSKISDEMPMIGPAIGAVMSVVTSLFQQSIQTMVTDIQNQVQAINLQASTKQIGIQQQIAELKQAEQTAISELGGKKKAQSQLQSILTSLNSQITQLQAQAAQTVQQFNDMAKAGSLGNMTGIMASWATTWEQINQQVEQYVQAGGSISTAAEYLNQQLQQQRQTLQDQMNSGNTTAINDAIQLNQLLTQRVQMMKDEANTEFGMINADSMERQTSNAVKLGTELSKQRATYALNLQTTNSQIALDQGRVAAESQIFTIATSLAALQAQSNALNITALNEQLLKYQDMATLLKATNGMVFTPSSINPNAGLNGAQAGIPGEPTVAGPITFQSGAIQINGDVTSTNATTLGKEIATSLRAGRAQF